MNILVFILLGVIMILFTAYMLENRKKYYWKNEYVSLLSNMKIVTVNKPKRPEKFSDKQYFGQCLMCFQNELRDLDIIDTCDDEITITVMKGDKSK